MKPMPLLPRFEAKYIPEPNSGCWLWVATMNGKYGTVSFNGRGQLAHRVSYEYFNGPIGDGLFVLHRCDVPSCVNPDHLFLGSQFDNMKDMTVKGRRVRGATHGATRLNEADILAIRDDDRQYKDIGAQYGLSVSTIYQIKAKKRWKHLA